MNDEANDIVCLTSGSLTQVQILHNLLRTAGIESRVVGDYRTAGLGTAIPGTIELWIHSGHAAAAAEVALAGANGH